MQPAHAQSRYLPHLILDIEQEKMQRPVLAWTGRTLSGNSKLARARGERIGGGPVAFGAATSIVLTRQRPIRQRARKWRKSSSTDKPKTNDTKYKEARKRRLYGKHHLSEILRLGLKNEPSAHTLCSDTDKLISNGSQPECHLDECIP